MAARRGRRWIGEEISPRKFARRESSYAGRLNFWENLGELLDEIFSVFKPKTSNRMPRGRPPAIEAYQRRGVEARRRG
jgi:hypothetical protein